MIGCVFAARYDAQEQRKDWGGAEPLGEFWVSGLDFVDRKYGQFEEYQVQGLRHTEIRGGGGCLLIRGQRKGRVFCFAKPNPDLAFGY
jgi:hypothetical protein